MVGPEGKDAAELRAELLLVATGRAANIEDIGLETTKVETDRGVIKVNGRMRTKEPHVYAIGDVIGGLWLAHTAAHEGIIAAHTIAGDADVHEMDYTRAAARDLLPARDRLDRPDRGAGDGARPHASRSARSRSRRSPRRSSAASTRASPRSSPTPRPTTRSASTSSGRTPRTSSPRRRSASSSRRRRGRSAARPTPTRRCPRSSARRRWPSTGGRSTSSAAPGRPASRGGRTTGDGRDQGQRLDASAPPSACPTPTSSRCTGYVALARAVDERMWILNRAGRIPFVISGQGHEGAQVGIAWAFEKGHDWIAPFYRSIATCLTFGMSRARHHDRAVRHGQRPVVRRPPDARPLRQRTSTTSCRSRRRSRRSCCTRSGSRWRPRSARPARSR